MYGSGFHCFVVRCIWSDCRTKWTIASTNTVVPCVNSKTVFISGKMGEIGVTKQITISSIRLVPAMRSPEKWTVG